MDNCCHNVGLPVAPVWYCAVIGQIASSGRGLGKGPLPQLFSHGTSNTAAKQWNNMTTTFTILPSGRRVRDAPKWLLSLNRHAGSPVHTGRTSHKRSSTQTARCNRTGRYNRLDKISAACLSLWWRFLCDKWPAWASLPCYWLSGWRVVPHQIYNH